jgi:hypothetical protein
MHDFEQETTLERVILHPLSDEAKKYLKERLGFYRKFYNENDGLMIFQLPSQKAMLEDYRKRLIAAKFWIREVSKRAAVAE